MKCAGILAFSFLLFSLVTFSIAQTITGKVVGVHDGDTLTVLQDKQEIKVRLNGIDAPESKQDYGSRAKQSLSALVFGKTVTVQISDTDRYGRKIGDIAVDEVHVNLRMVEQGMAWHYTDYSKSATLAAAEKAARESKAGLWADANPVPPWQFRKVKKAESAPSSAPANLTGPAKEASVTSQTVGQTYWLNTGSGVRHNKNCKSFGTTKAGRYCGANEGKGCGQCGG